MGVDLVDQVLIGHQRDSEYVMHGQPTFGGFGWIVGFESEADG